MENDYTMIVEVLAEPGESNIAITDVSDTDMEVLEPMLLDIQQHRGYYPTGGMCKRGQPTARDLYRKHQGWDVFESIVPRPPSGVNRIISVRLFRQEPLKMEML